MAQYISAATAASPEPMAKVVVIILLTLMPTKVDASLSCGTARIALPSFVFLTKSCKAIIMPRPMAIVSSTFSGRATLPTVMVGRLKMACTLWGLAPNSTMARFSKKMLIASAVISADIGPALRTGR